MSFDDVVSRDEAASMTISFNVLSRNCVGERFGGPQWPQSTLTRTQCDYPTGHGNKSRPIQLLKQSGGCEQGG